MEDTGGAAIAIATRRLGHVLLPGAWLRSSRANGVDVSAIKGVIPISGVFDIRVVPEIFGKDEAFAKDQSPIDHVKAGLPPFLLTYCQWDYPVLAPQAEDFAVALRRSGNRVDTLYVPGQSHVSEIVHVQYEDDP